jgi:hypothetical protein
MTDAQGNFSFLQKFGAGGIISPWVKHGRFSIANNVRIEAEGYQIVEVPLASFAGEKRSVRNKQPIIVSIALDKVAGNKSMDPAAASYWLPSGLP